MYLYEHKLLKIEMENRNFIYNKEKSFKALKNKLQMAHHHEICYIILFKARKQCEYL